MGKQRTPLLSVRNLRTQLYGKEDMITIVDGVNLEVRAGETVGLIGETGAGKTVTARAILRILQPLGKSRPTWNIEGEVIFKGRDLLRLSKEEVRDLRGSEISAIFQNPIPSLHPIDIIGYQTGEPIEAHEDLERQKIRKLVEEYLGKVRLPDAKKRFRSVRDQFSGGEAQRILIAMALINNPALLIADEPTSALDVAVQRQILELLKEMKELFGLSMLFITHNLGVIAEMSDSVCVMYAGRIMENADVHTIFRNPRHPYTMGLLAAVPRIDVDSFEFKGIRGEPPIPPYNIPGCIFHPRCEYAKPVCSKKLPSRHRIGPEHSVACLRVHEITH